MNRTRKLLAISLAVGALGLSACSDDHSSSPVTAAANGESSSSIEEDVSNSAVQNFSSADAIVSSSSANVVANSSSDVASSSEVAISSSSTAQANGEAVACYEHDYYNPEIQCIVRCDIRTFHCDDGKTFKNELEFGKFVLNERKTNPSFANNCGNFEIRCTTEDNLNADPYQGGCDLIGLTCPDTSEPMANYSSSSIITSSNSDTQWEAPCSEASAIVGTACTVDDTEYGMKVVGGCGYQCYEGKWEYLAPPTSEGKQKFRPLRQKR